VAKKKEMPPRHKDTKFHKNRYPPMDEKYEIPGTSYNLCDSLSLRAFVAKKIPLKEVAPPSDEQCEMAVKELNNELEILMNGR